MQRLRKIEHLTVLGAAIPTADEVEMMGEERNPVAVFAPASPRLRSPTRRCGRRSSGGCGLRRPRQQQQRFSRGARFSAAVPRTPRREPSDEI